MGAIGGAAGDAAGGIGGELDAGEMVAMQENRRGCPSLSGFTSWVAALATSRSILPADATSWRLRDGALAGIVGRRRYTDEPEGKEGTGRERKARTLR